MKSSLLQKAVLKLVNPKMSEIGIKAHKRLDRMTRNPMETQKQFLLQLLRDNQDTEYGKKHGFADIHSIEEYQQRVPLSSYDDYAEAIERMAMKGEKNILTAYNVNHYSKSSGTMGNPKLIPFSEKAVKISDEFIKGSNDCIASRYKMLGNTKSINLVESHLEILPSGATYGSYTARVISDLRKLLEIIQIPPTDVMIPKEPMNTRYLLALYALRQEDLSYCICAFYSYFVEVLRCIEKNWQMLADDIEQGTINPTINMPEDVRRELTAKMKKDPKRAEQIRSIMRDHQFETMMVPQLWPRFRFVSGIGTAGFSTYTEKLRNYFGPDIHFLFVGLTASEGIFSTLYDKDTTSSVLVPDSVFYEFKPEDQDGYDHLLTMDQLEEGKNYELVITNLSGFYRYKMKDVVRVVGKYNNTPTIEFMYRANQTVNLVGEKTTEVALREVAKQVADKCGFKLMDYCMYPNPDAVPVRYEFLLEPYHLPDDFDWQHARDVLDECLAAANPSMGDKLAKGIVGKSKLYFLSEETTMLYRDMMIFKGASSAQLKPVRIIDNVVRHNFFYALIDERFDTPEEKMLFDPTYIVSD